MFIDVRPPFLGDEGRRCVWGSSASMGGVELLQHRHGLQQGSRVLKGVEGERLEEGRGHCRK
jgi:hypothetical protein